MLVIKNNQELEFIKQAVIKLKQNENFQEQLVYYIGFNYTMGKFYLEITRNPKTSNPTSGSWRFY
jgi:hypothetical protein